MDSSCVPVAFETCETLVVLVDWCSGVMPVDLSKGPSEPSHGNMGWKQDGSGMGRAFSAEGLGVCGSRPRNGELKWIQVVYRFSAHVAGSKCTLFPRFVLYQYALSAYWGKFFFPCKRAKNASSVCTCHAFETTHWDDGKK